MAGDATYAVIVLDDKEIELVRQREKILKSVQCLDKEISILEFVDYLPDFYSTTEAKKLVAKACKYGRDVGDFLEGQDIRQILDEELSEAKTESIGYCVMCVEEGGFYWEMSPKHTTIRVQTPKFKFAYYL
jgi:hypothetical protein